MYSSISQIEISVDRMQLGILKRVFDRRGRSKSFEVSIDEFDIELDDIAEGSGHYSVVTVNLLYEVRRHIEKIVPASDTGATIRFYRL